MARCDFVSGTAERAVTASASHDKNVTEFRGMDLDTLAKQYALYRRLNALDEAAPAGTGSKRDEHCEAGQQPPGLMNRILGKLAVF